MPRKKELIQKLKANWDHDIKRVDGQFIEDIVMKFQKTKRKDKREQLIRKIIDNYALFLKKWSPLMLPFHDNDMEAVNAVYNEVIWRAALKYKPKKGYKNKGKKFNAFLVSSLINRCRNDRTKESSIRHHPNFPCPICKETVHSIDANHLKHIVTLRRYQQVYKNYPLVSSDGNIRCPISGQFIPAITHEHLNRVAGYYTVNDFKYEFSHLLPKSPVRCPITMMSVKELDSDYLSSIKRGYTAKQFLNDFPDFTDIVACPFSGQKLLEVTQEHLDKVLKQEDKTQYTMRHYLKTYPHAPIKSKPVKVMNPYTGKMVWKISPLMLKQANTTAVEHLQRYVKYKLNERYQDFVFCPFTGKRTHRITRSYLRKIQRTAFEFYCANSQYPLQKWQIRCGVCGEWVDNIWDHLKAAEHIYSEPMTMEEYISIYGVGATKQTVVTNSFTENEEGESMPLADVLMQKKNAMHPADFEDSLLRGAIDEFDRKVAFITARKSNTFDDVLHFVPERKTISLPPKTKKIRQFIKKQLGINDFDFQPADDEKEVEVTIPCKETVKETLLRLFKESDLV